jgi:hypothetical protein
MFEGGGVFLMLMLVVMMLVAWFGLKMMAMTTMIELIKMKRPPSATHVERWGGLYLFSLAAHHPVHNAGGEFTVPPQ